MPTSTTDRPLTAGITDPLDPALWLVRPWPTDASFCEVVGHFLTTYVWRLQSERSVARQLAYFEAYQSALATASTHELTYAADWRWHDDLVRCIGDCVAVFRRRAAEEGPNSMGEVVRLRPDAPTISRKPIRRGRAS
jgi:hypothetical protein